MGKVVRIVVLLVFFTTLLADQIKAEDSWWSKGADILRSLGGQNGESTASSGEQISTTDLREAFKQALRIATGNVVNRLGVADGFNLDPAIHIPLPEELQSVKTLLTNVGMGYLAEDLELKLNRAAEAATPKARELFLQAIREITFTDLQEIYTGPDDSATRYFESKMTRPLLSEMQPIVENTLSQVGAVSAYDRLVGQYKSLPFVPDVKANLTQHVLRRGLRGIFFYMAKEEQSIRRDPARQTTELLKKVFGMNK